METHGWTAAGFEHVRATFEKNFANGLEVGAAFTAGLVDAIAGGGGLICFPALVAVGLPPHLADPDRRPVRPRAHGIEVEVDGRHGTPCGMFPHGRRP